jgi:hypothetical protein
MRRASIGSAPKLDIASTIRPLPWRSQTLAISASGFSTPVPVSQCTNSTWVTEGSAFSRSSSAAADTGTSSANGITVALRPIICVSLAARLQ